MIVFLYLLAMFAFNTKHHALLAHLARLRQPGLGGKPLLGTEKTVKLDFEKQRGF